MSGLHITERPNKLKDVIGNKGAIECIRGFMNRAKEDIPQTWLFQGPPGCGKTTLARIVRNELGVRNLNFHEYNSANMRGIDTIREISRNAASSPLGGGEQAYLIDECHQITGPAQEAFLKVLEDVPKNTWFFLATTNPEKLRPAIKSRSTIISVTRVNNKEAKNLIERTLKNLGLKSIPVTVQKQIIQHANGACRDILKLLDTIIDISDENDMLDAVNTAYANASTVKELWTALLDKKEAKLKWKKVSAILKNIDEEPEQVRQAMLTVLSNNLLDTGSVKTLGMIEAFEDAYHSTGKAGLVMSCFNACYI